MHIPIRYDKRNKKMIEPGFIIVIPSNAKHQGKSITDCQLIDLFYPVREDYR
jgi:quercetin dioxygenase-like cupin family protein